MSYIADLQGVYIHFFVILSTLVYVIYKLWTRKYKYWEIRGVFYQKPSFPLGTMPTELLFQKVHISQSNHKVYNQIKAEKYIGLWEIREPQLMIKDLEICKHILTKDFSHFVDRGMFRFSKEHDFLNNHLFNMEGESWRKMRQRLTPTFTSGKMKFMFNFIEVVSQQLTDYLTPLAGNEAVVEIKDLIARFNTDIIASCAFGLEVNSLKDPNSQFRNIGKLIFTPAIINDFKEMLTRFVPGLHKIIPIVLTKPEVSEFIMNVLKDTMAFRKKNGLVRNDFIDLLIKEKEKTSATSVDQENNFDNGHKDVHRQTVDEFTLKDMAAQMFVFFAAGFETAASTTSFCLYELSKNKVIQDKLRAEIDSVLQKNGGKITYQGLQDLHYMDQCINETLRMYASLSFLKRQCVKRYQVPGSNLVIDEGITVTIPTYSIHHDPENYPDPFTYDPERFTDEAISSRHHYSFLPFGEGPRVCIGKRLGLMQVKMAVIAILKDFSVTPAPGLPDHLKLDPTQFITSSLSPIELIVSQRGTNIK